MALEALSCISLQLPSGHHRPSIPLSRYVVRLPGGLSQLRLRPLSLSATAASAFYLASAAPPLTSPSGHNNQSPDEQWETDGSGWDGGSSGGGAVGDHNGDNNRKAALMVLPRVDWPSDNPPVDLDRSEASRFSELEKSPLVGLLLWFGGMKERLLVADDGFLEKASVELGIFTKTAQQNFFKELEIVFADVVIAMIADFMSVHLPVPTASLARALSKNAGPIAELFQGCPGNAFQIALPGASYSLAQRLGAIALNGAMLFATGTASSMVRIVVRRNALIDARKVVEKSSGGEVENVPILSTSLAYGVYMATSSNLRSQVLDGVIDQRIMEPLLHQHKLMLSAIRFAVQTGNIFLGSMLWTDYARRIGIDQ